MFNYYYGHESVQFYFLQLPKALLREPIFSRLSDRAKILYSLLLDRMHLSQENGWFDKDNRVFIIFSVKDIAKELNCSLPSVCKALAELDAKSGIGLIERVKKGQGTPDIIYVKNFVSDTEQGRSEGKTPEKEPRKINRKESENSKVLNSTSLNSKSLNSRIQKSDTQEFNIVESNNNKNNNTNKIIRDEIDHTTEQDEERLALYNTIKQNLSLDIIESMADTERKEIMLELFHLVCDILLSNPPTIQINSTEYPYELVKDQFMRLRMDHLEYVVESIRNRKGNKIGNIRSFLITALYNAPNTMTSNLFQDYIQSEGTPYRTRFEYFAEEKRKERDKKR